jgi:hypothetical protein
MAMTFSLFLHGKCSQCMIVESHVKCSFLKIKKVYFCNLCYLAWTCLCLHCKMVRGRISRSIVQEDISFAFAFQALASKKCKSNNHVSSDGSRSYVWSRLNVPFLIWMMSKSKSFQEFANHLMLMRGYVALKTWNVMRFMPRKPHKWRAMM